jgi:5-methylcytosine-specific restriction protein A
MSTYLLTWNPKESSVEHLAAAWQRQCKGMGVQAEQWSCGSNKSIAVGARVFLHRQVKEPRGIVASGWVSRQSYQDEHWDPARASKGDTANYIDWIIDAVCEGFGDDSGPIEPLPVHAIGAPPVGTQVRWNNIPGSGIRIPTEAAREIEKRWARHLSTQVADEGQGEMLVAIEGDPRLRLIWSRSRESSLREAKLLSARSKSHDGMLRCEVPGCGFCFEKVYGDIGKGFAHVHHVNALGRRDGSQVTTLDDLVVVCANCHAMIHRHGECRPLQGLIES